MKPPAEVTLTLPCPVCSPQPTIRVPMTTTLRGVVLTVSIPKRPVRLAVAAHVRQHKQP